MIKLKRVYDPFDVTDGLTILVDRLWPRGVRRSTPNVELWMRDVAPSDVLRKKYGHELSKWRIFKVRYISELNKNDMVESLLELIRRTNDTVTFVYAASDKHHNNAIILKRYIERKLKRKPKPMRAPKK